MRTRKHIVGIAGLCAGLCFQSIVAGKPIAAEAALPGGSSRGAGTEFQYLSGHGLDDAVAWEFLCSAGQNHGVWTNIPVPSCWELQGFGAYGYSDDPVKEQGQYRYRFRVPAKWQGKVIRMVFEGVMTDTEVWINGQSAGPKHQGGFYRFTYDVTRLVKVGDENVLEATVSKSSANDSVNAAERRGDYWNFGGIFRPVYLEALPPAFIERTAIDARADGSFAIEVYLGGNSSVVDRVTAHIVGMTEPSGVIPAGGRAVLKTKVTGQKNWTAETPDLYRVVVTLEGNGRALHTIRQSFGFRTIEVRDGDGVYVNGRRVMLKGCCRHSFWPESGRTLSDRINRSDVLLMKEMNMNAVRMSHYPPDADFLDKCDELGLYVLDELGGWQKKYDAEIGRKLVEAMVMRDVNHPCILFWDNGNEGGWNSDLDGEFGKWDPQLRRVLHPWAVAGGIDTKHYSDYGDAKRRCAGKTVYMPTEFLHSLYDGGAGAGLDDYWKLMSDSKVGAGGFIWALLDEGVVRTDKHSLIDCQGNLAPDGIVGPHREKEGSFNAIREIWCPVQVHAEALPAVRVDNLYDFINLEQCRFTWELATFSMSQTGHTVRAHGVVTGPKVAPHTSGALVLDLPADWRKADVLYLTVTNPEGRDLWTWSWPLNRGIRDMIKPTGGKVEVHDEVALAVRSGNMDLTFDKKTGYLVKAGNFSLGNGPRFVVGGAPTPNLPGKLLSLSNRMEGANAVVEARYEGALNDVRWTIFPGGLVKLEYRYSFDGECKLVGVQFDYPEKLVKSMRWLGDGPYRVWKNRLKGGVWDVWGSAYNDTVPGESWIYPEFKGYFGDWQWAIIETTEGAMTLMTEQDHSYLGVYRPREGREPKDTKMLVPPTGLAFLDEIPAIGTKFGAAETLGPQSQPAKGPGVCSRTIYMRFEYLGGGLAIGRVPALQADNDTAPLNVHVPSETITDDSALLLWDKPSAYEAGSFKHFQVYCDGKPIGITTKLGYKVSDLKPVQTATFTVAMVTHPDQPGAPSVPVKISTKAVSPVIDVKACGAVGDGVTVDTAAIRKAIAACPKGGTVLIPAGVFVSGPLFLKSDMTLRIDGTLKGSARLADYLPLIPCRFEGFELDCYPSLLTLGRLDHRSPAVISNVVICGKGTIDASGYELGDRQSSASGNRSRGRAVCMMNAENISLQDLTVVNAPAWTIHAIYSRQVTFAGLRVISRESKDRRIPNGDGIDPDSSSDINIFNCTFRTGDDAIAVKSGKNFEGFTIGKPAENVRITDCIIDNSMGGIVIGSEMSGSVRHVRVENCQIGGLDWEGLDIKSSLGRGGTVEDVGYRDITINGARAGIRVTTAYSVNNDGKPAPEPPRISNIRYQNVHCSNVQTGLQVCGSPKSIISNITLRDCKIVGISGGANLKYVDNIRFERTDPEKWELNHVTGKQ